MEKPVMHHRYDGKDQKKIVDFTFEYDDIFSVKGFLSAIKEWLEENDYFDDKGLFEKYYLQRETVQGKQVLMRWRFQKEHNTDRKIWRFDLDVDIAISGLQEVEFLSNGKKVKADKGKIVIVIIGHMVKDYEKVWESTALLKRYKDWIFKNPLGQETKSAIGALKKDGEGLQSALKEYFRVKGGSGLSDFTDRRPIR